MQKGHKGLSEAAKAHDVYVSKLKPGEHVVFVNKKVNKIKIFSANNIVSYLNTTHRLDLGALQWFAECFGAHGFEYSQALKKVLLQRMKEVN